MAKNNDIWLQKYTYNSNNPRLQVIKIHPQASDVVDAVLYSRHNGNIGCPHSGVDVIQKRALDLFSVELRRNTDYHTEELNALCEDIVNTFNFVGIPMDLYLSYQGCRRLPYNLTIACRITLDLNFDAELLKGYK